MLIVLVVDEHAFVVEEAAADAIALMGIQINVEDFVLGSECFQCAEFLDGDGDIGIGREAVAVIGAGVMVSSGHIDGQARLERRLCGDNRAAGGPAHGTKHAIVHGPSGQIFQRRNFQDAGDKGRVPEFLQIGRGMDSQ